MNELKVKIKEEIKLLSEEKRHHLKKFLIIYFQIQN